MLTGYDFTELQLEDAKINKEDAEAAKIKALADLNKPKAAPPVKQKTGADSNEKDSGEDSDGEDSDNASLQNIWNDVDKLGDAA
jgi:hypothetical protein